ncbi:MAG: SIS domain-containing protein [Terracidiphilus sp.]|jgi:D-sedoheptulose 7-phosphate isomerase
MSYCADYQAQLLQIIRNIDLPQVDSAISWFQQARDEGRQIFVCGNGGSASTASHFVTDMVKGASYGRHRRFRIHALTDSLSTITAYANDVSYDCVFAEQLKNHAASGDLLLCISGSGNSPNVLAAAEYARLAGCRIIALTGRDGGKLAPMADLHIGVAHPHMGRIEDLHLIVCHMICYNFMDSEPVLPSTPA